MVGKVLKVGSAQKADLDLKNIQEKLKINTRFAIHSVSTL
jgi:hypothetical protein